MSNYTHIMARGTRGERGTSTRGRRSVKSEIRNAKTMIVMSNKRAAEETQDENQATKVNRVQRGERRLRRVPVYMEVPESKFIEPVASVTVDTTISVIDFMQLINEGTGNQGARIGDKINIKSILSRLAVSQPATNTLGVVYSTRLMLVYDRQSNGASIETSKLLTSNANVFSALNSDNAGRYRVIWDKIIMTTAGTAESSEIITQNNIFKTGLPVHYDASTSSIGNVEKGNIALVLLSRLMVTGTTSVAPSVYYDIKFSYKDV